jgi:hypothetical protein
MSQTYWKCAVLAFCLLTVLAFEPIACSSSDNKGTSNPPTIQTTPSVLPIVTVPYVFQGMGHSGMYITKPPALTLAADWPVVPDQMVIYRINKPEINDQTVDQIAAKFGFSAADAWPLIGPKRVVYSYVRGDQTLEINLDGGIGLHQSTSISNGTPSLPDDEKAITIARDFLAASNLYPQNVIRIEIGYGGLSAATVDTQTGKTSATTYYSKAVRFVAGIGSYEVSSLSAFILVGDQGKIIWAELKPFTYQEYGVAKLKDPQAALDILKTELGRLTPVSSLYECTFNPYASSITIKDISIQYLKGVSTDFIQPVYYFKGTADFANSAPTEDFLGMVDAIQR